MKLSLSILALIALGAGCAESTPKPAETTAAREPANLPVAENVPVASPPASTEAIGPSPQTSATDGYGAVPAGSGPTSSTAAGQAGRTNTPTPTEPGRGAQGGNEQAASTEDRRSAPPASDRTAAAPDNTGVNERDRSGAALTPMDQGGSEADRRMTAEIRRAVVADSALSFTAKNVKIITIGGRVTLRGPVKSATERDAIERKAKSVAGVKAVDNLLDVK